MMSPIEVIQWLESLPVGSLVGVDEGGLTLVAVDEDTHPTGPYLEVGGIPAEMCEDIYEQPVTDEERSNGPRRGQ